MRYAENKIKGLYREIRKNWWTLSKYIEYTHYAEDDLECDIVLVTHTAIKGGAPVLVKNIADYFKKKHFRILIIALEPGELLESMRGICPTILCTTRYQLKKVASKLSQKDVRAVLCYSALSGNASVIFSRYGMRIISFVYELPNTIIGSVAIDRYKRIVENSECVVYPSTFVRDRDEKEFKINKKGLVKAQGLYNKNPNHFSKNIAKAKIGLENKMVVLNVASTSKRKGFDYFVEVAKSMPEITFIWVGVQHNGFYNKILSENNNEFPKNFIEIGYISDLKELSLYYDAADVFMMPSREEPFGSVFIEAFDAGTPVVAFNNCGGYLDFVKTGVTGCLAESQTSDSLRKAVNYVIENTERYKKMQVECIRVASKLGFKEYVDYIEYLISGEENE